MEFFFVFGKLKKRSYICKEEQKDMKKILSKITDFFRFGDVTEDFQYDIPLTIREVYSLNNVIDTVPENDRNDEISNVSFMLKRAIEHYEATYKA